MVFTTLLFSLEYLYLYSHVVQWSFYGLRSAHKRKAMEQVGKDEENPNSAAKLEMIDVE
jgi:hypothetical protein